MGLLKFLFITICILWLIKMIARVLLPLAFQKIINNAQNQANQRYQPKEEKRPDGRIRVDYVPPKDNNRDDQGGDFVEYEEIKTP